MRATLTRKNNMTYWKTAQTLMQQQLHAFDDGICAHFPSKYYSVFFRIFFLEAHHDQLIGYLKKRGMSV